MRPEPRSGPRRSMPWGDLPRGSFPGDGLAVIDKDPGVTSHDVVGAVRRLAGTKKAGHAGTLDPMATGVLCIGLGRATKLLRYVTGTAKEYEATIRFGIETSTEDAQGEIVRARGAREADAAELARAMANLTGDVLQVPSSVSALKVEGRRAYDLVREGREVVLDARPIRVDVFEAVGGPRFAEACGAPVFDVDVRVVCGAGTYVRALARDLGEELGFGAHLTSLRRTRVGPWDVGEAASVRECADAVEADGQMPVLTLADLCRAMFPALEVSEEAARDLRMGRFVSADSPFDFLGVKAAASDALAPSAAGRDAPGSGPDGRGSGSAVAVAWSGGTPVALVSRRGGRVKPDLLLTPASEE